MAFLRFYKLRIRPDPAKLASSSPGLERRVQAVCRLGIHQGWIRSAHDSAEGGLAVAIAESAIAGSLGARVNLGELVGHRPDWLLFAEGGARILVSVDPAHVAVWEAELQAQIPAAWQAIGTVTEADAGLAIAAGNQPLVQLSVDQLQQTWGGAIERRLAKD